MGLNSKGIKERISLLAGISVFLLILGASAATAGSISGVVFNDNIITNGVQDAGEAGLSGWKINLISGTSYPALAATATTDLNGNYTFPDLTVDVYLVAEIPQTGWTQTTPQDPRYGAFPDFPCYYGIELYPATLTVTDINFGNYGGGGGGGNGVTGKMTGKGSVGTAKFDFELNCDKDKKPMELEVNWGKGNKFSLETLTSASCSDDSAINPEKPSAGFDTYTGAGTGSYNKLSGYTASWTFKDAGEPGKDDTAVIQIYDAGGSLVLDVSGTLKDGNIQAHNK